jgi:putative endonuclease
MNYKCYIIFNDNFSYVGITNNLKRRIRQHNCEIKGGAKYTSLINSRLITNWNYACYIDGFKTKNDALKFEWALKHVKPRYKSGIINRINKLLILLNKEKWTNNSPPALNYKLKIVWCELFLIPEVINIPSYIKHDFNFLL